MWHQKQHRVKLDKDKAVAGKYNLEGITIKDLDFFEFLPVLPVDEWLVGIVREVIKVCEKSLDVENFTAQELEKILEYVCT